MTKKMLKSIISCMLALMMIVPLFAIPSSAAIALSKTTINLTKGYATTLKVTGTSRTVKWSTGDKSVATVTSAGKVSGKRPGTTYIYANVSNTTLKCKVNVVAGKITAGISELSISAGKTTRVNIIAKGTHTISCSSSDKSVATCSWNGAKFDEDIIPLTIKGVKSGTARIKVYAKNYPSTVYAYIDVTVGNGSSSSSTIPSTTDVTITPKVSSIKVDVNATATFTVLTTAKNSLTVASGNNNMFTASVSSYTAATNGYYYATVSIKGLVAGSNVVRIYSTANKSNYKDVNVTVGAAAVTYYNVTTTYPTKSLTSDIILNYSYNSTNYYMLAPSNYDIAYCNTQFAAYKNTYEYYTMYSASPTKKVSTDYIQNVSTTAGTRYVLVPKDVDQPALNTAVAQYKDYYEYYVIYNVKPTYQSSWDSFVTWNITDSNNKTVTRYMLVEMYPDTDKIDQIKNADLNANTKTTYEYYKVTTIPYSYVASGDTMMSWTSVDGSYKFMVVPNKNCDYLKRNDAIAKDSGVYYLYNIYSAVPIAIKNTNGIVVTKLSNNSYFIYKEGDSIDVYTANLLKAQEGYYSTLSIS